MRLIKRGAVSPAGIQAEVSDRETYSLLLEEHKSSSIKEPEPPSEDPLDKARWPKVVTHGEFLFNGKVRKYAFISKEDLDNKSTLSQLFKLWKLQPPNLVVQFNNQNTMFEHYVTEEMLETEAYVKLKASLQPADASLEEINQHVLNRIASIFGAVAVACDMTNSWFVDQGTPQSNAVLFGWALKECQASPVVFTADHFYRYKDFDHGGKLVEFHEKLRQCSVPIGGKEKIKERPTIALSQNELYFEARYEEVFGPDGNPVRVPRDSPAWDEVPLSLRKFEYSAPWDAATHFLMLENPDDFDASVLGTAGFILFGGGYRCKDQDLQWAISNGLPTILVDNTGRETQQWARLIAKIKKLRDEVGLATPSALLARAHEIHSFAVNGTKNYPEGDFGMNQLKLPGVLRAIDLICERPTYFKETLMIVDVLEDSSDAVVKKVSKSFASKMTHAHEAGSGNADELSVLAAWRLHRVLTGNAKAFWKRDCTLVLLAAVCTLLGTVVAILLTTPKDVEMLMQHLVGASVAIDDGMFLLQRSSVILPGFASFFGGAAVVLRYKAQAATLEAAAARIVQDIFAFRMRIGKYGISGSSQADVSGAGLEEEPDENAQPVETSESVRLYAARSEFHWRIRQHTIVLGVVSDADLQFPDDLAKADLRDYVEQQLYGVKLSLDENRVPGPPVVDQPLLIHTPETQDVDIEHLESMSTSEYFMTRTRPLLVRYRGEAPYFAWIDGAFTVLVLVLTTGATIFAALEYQTVVPIIYAVSAFARSVQIYAGWSARKAAMMRAIADLTMLDAYWASLTFVDRGLPSTRTYLVEVTEAASLLVSLVDAGLVADSGARTDDTPAGGSNGKDPASDKNDDKNSKKKT